MGWVTKFVVEALSNAIHEVNLQLYSARTIKFLPG